MVFFVFLDVLLWVFLWAFLRGRSFGFLCFLGCVCAEIGFEVSVSVLFCASIFF